MLDKQRMIKILQNKIDEGYKIIENLKINEKEFATTVVNMFEVVKTIDQLQQEEAFDKEMSDKEKEAIKEIQSKNEEVCL